MKKRKEHESAFSYKCYLGQMLEQVEDDYSETQQETKTLQEAKDVKDEGGLYFSRGMVLGYKEILEKFRTNAEAYGIKLQDQDAMEPREPNLLAYQSYTYKTLRQLLDTYRELEQEKESKNINARNDAESKLISGRTLAYYSVLEQFRADAEIFEIPLKEIGLEEVIQLF